MRLPNKEFRKLVKDLRDPKKKKEIYLAQEQKKISWPEYNLSKINELKAVLKFIKDSVNEVKLRESKSDVGRPSISPHLLAKAILFCEFDSTPERQGEGWLELFGLI